MHFSSFKKFSTASPRDPAKAHLPQHALTTLSNLKMTSTDTTEITPDVPAASRQPRKRFVGKKTADTLRSANGTPASIEDTGSALAGM